MIHRLLFLSAMAALTMLIGCSKTPPNMTTDLPLVVVESVQVRDVPLFIYANGVATARETVHISARVDGVLQEILYSPGEQVAAGTALFHIEPTPYQMEVQITQATLDSAKAKFELCEANLARTKSLLDSAVATTEEWQTEVTAKNQAAAEVVRHEALLADAKIKLGYTEVCSPIRGMTDRNLVDMGNFVGPNSPNSVLTTVVGLNPISILFSVSDSDFSTIRQIHSDVIITEESQKKEREEIIQRIQTGWSTAHTGDSISVVAPLPETEGTTHPNHAHSQWDFPSMTLFFEIGIIEGTSQPTDVYPWRGLIELSGNMISTSTGTVLFRGVIPNEDHQLLPGQVCRVRIPIAPIKEAILVKQEAVGHDLNRDYVYLLGENDTVHRKTIEIGPHQKDGMVVVTQGLDKNDRYLTTGLQRVRDGRKVRFQESP